MMELINKQKLIEELDQAFDCGVADHFDDIINIIELQEIIEPAKEPSWIPCSERLPENSGDYLTTAANEILLILPYSKKHKKFNYYDSCSKDTPTDLAIDVIAWKPLPEPYKKGTKQ